MMRLMVAFSVAISLFGAVISASGEPESSTAPAKTPASSGAPVSLDQIRAWNESGQTDLAESAARAALNQAERAHGKESLEAAEVLDELAVALRRGGKTADPEALAVCERAIRIKRLAVGERDPRFAASLHNRGLLHFMRRDYSQALSDLQQALEIRQATLGGNHPDIAKSLLALGSVRHDLGDYSEALSLTERAVAIEEIALGRENPQRARGLDALAVARYGVGDFSGAIPLFEEAIGLWEHAPNPNQAALAACYHNLGAVYASVGDHARAITVLERALHLREQKYGPNHLLVANTLSELGSVFEEVGSDGRAGDCFRRSVRILELGAPRSRDLGWVREKLGWLYLEQGDVRRAGDAFQRSLREKEDALGPEHPDLWMSLLGMAKVAWRRGQIDSARAYYERTERLLRKSSGPEHPDLGRTLVEYASFQIAVGDSESAVRTALEAARITRDHLRLTVRGIPERQALLYIANMDTGIDVALAGIAGTLRLRSQDLVRQVWGAVIRSRTLVLDEMIERARMVGKASDVVAVAKRLEAAQNRLANLLVRHPSGEPDDPSRDVLQKAREEVERGEVDLAARSASFHHAQERDAIGFEEVRSALPAGSALVSIVRYGAGNGQGYLAFVTGTDGTPEVVVLGPAKRIDRLISRWRDLAGTPPEGGARRAVRAEDECRRVGADLRAAIWDPFADRVRASGMVFLVPDGSFHLLNFAALPRTEGGYLVESPFVLHLLSSERDLVTDRERRASGVGLLALGGAAFDSLGTEPPGGSQAAAAAGDFAAQEPADSTSSSTDCEGFRSVRFQPLPETLREIDSISSAWGQRGEVVTLTGARATEHAVKELMPGKRVAHLATHGFFLDEACGRREASLDTDERGIGGLSVYQAPHSPPRIGANPFRLAGLALAGANRRDETRPDEDDGILTAEEIASLDLSGLDWVVLSACDTGLGEIRSGEGVLGLRRAFESAGAGTLIMSLWAVNDRWAREWMTLLYDARFQNDLETAAAVRAADLGTLHSLRTEGRSTLPFYWASFVAAGGWR